MHANPETYALPSRLICCHCEQSPRHACTLFASCSPTSCMNVLFVLGTMTDLSKAICVCHLFLCQNMGCILLLIILCMDTAAGFQQFSTCSKQTIRQCEAAKGSVSAVRLLTHLFLQSPQIAASLLNQNFSSRQSVSVASVSTMILIAKPAILGTRCVAAATTAS